jgi:hypothetical protein
VQTQPPKDATVRVYLIDELRKDQVGHVCSHLEHKGFKGPIKDIYWFEVPFELLASLQQEHFPQCGPYIFSLETGKTWLRLELLVRPKNVVRCECIGYAGPKQRAYIIDRLDEIIRELDIPV